MRPYEQMVKDLFKPNPSNAWMAHHATTGIMGEITELLEAPDRKNMIEELSDAQFYVVALQQRLAFRPGGIELTSEVINATEYKPTLGTVLLNLTLIAGQLLDLTKKSWVYERELKEYEIWQKLELLRINMDFLTVSVLDTTWEYLEDFNMYKLLKGENARYKSGTYSNEAALARADKK